MWASILFHGTGGPVSHLSLYFNLLCDELLLLILAHKFLALCPDAQGFTACCPVLGMLAWGYLIVCPGPRVVFDLTEYSSSRISSHQLLPPVTSVLVTLASVQLIPVRLIKLPPVTSLFLSCTTQHETAKSNPSPAAASGKANINLRERRFSLCVRWGAIRL